MEPFEIVQKIELSGENGPLLYGNCMEQDDSRAHRWRISVTRCGRPADMNGYSATCYAVRKDEKLYAAKADVQGSEVSILFDSGFTKAEGQTIAQMVLSDADGHDTTLATLYYGVRKTRKGELVTADERVIDLAGMLAMLDEFRAAETARETAERARADAEAHRDAAEQERECAEERRNEEHSASMEESAAQANRARAAADQLSSLEVTVEMLEPSSAPGAIVTRTDTSTAFHLQIPKSDLAVATFEISDSMELLAHTPDGLDAIRFNLNDEGELEVEIK